MTVQDRGIEQLGSYIRGLSPSSVGYCAFGTGGSAFTGSSINLTREVIRVAVSWSVVGSGLRGESTLNTTQANGSYITEIGLVHDSSLGSDLFSGDLSSIGSKNATFSVIVDQAVTIRRAT